MIINGPSVCRLCEEIHVIKNGLIKMPLYGKKKYLTKISFPIGEFNQLNFQPMLMNY